MRGFGASGRRADGWIGGWMDGRTAGGARRRGEARARAQVRARTRTPVWVRCAVCGVWVCPVTVTVTVTVTVALELEGIDIGVGREDAEKTSVDAQLAGGQAIPFWLAGASKLHGAILGWQLAVQVHYALGPDGERIVPPRKKRRRSWLDGVTDRRKQATGSHALGSRECGGERGRE